MDEVLRRDIRRLGALLGQVMREVAGPELFGLEEDIRHLAKARRAGDADAEGELLRRVEALDDREARGVIRAFTLFFDLANLAEDRHRTRVLRGRERAGGTRRESIPEAIRTLRDAGLTGTQVQALLDRLRLDLVFTAHPTEAKRRTVRSSLRRIRESLVALEAPDLLPREEERLERRILSELNGLWLTETVHPRRPTVLEEVARGLYFMAGNWEVVPRMHRDLRLALAECYPEHRFEIPVLVSFGSWIGGDRDGNPNVTAEVVAQTLAMLRAEALRLHRRQLDLLFESLSVSEALVGGLPEIASLLEQAAGRWPEAIARGESLSPRELYRRWLRVVEWRLERTAEVLPGGPWPEGAYRRAAELAGDLEALRRSLVAHGAPRMVEGPLAEWLDQVRIFGFHLARLDVREESSAYHAVVAEVMAAAGLDAGYASRSPDERRAALVAHRGWSGTLDAARLSPATRDCLDLFRLLADVGRDHGPEALGCLVISMTHHAADVLPVLWLAELVGPPDRAPLPIVPLFETIDDLHRAHRILADLLDDPWYAEHLRRSGDRQIAMVGYSDSTKDGGFLAANWALYRGQALLHQVAAARSVETVLFHGRGGALGRGGGPAARGILALPPETVRAGLRITEQGEVLAERYDDPAIAARHMEQLTWAMLTVTATPAPPPDPRWTALLDRAAAASFRAWRDLVEHPAFLPFFRQATPIEEIESLPLASRPSRRREQHSLQDLRAIPWVFSWTQCRWILPGWYGLGSGFAALEPEEREELPRMFREWPFFAATLSNAALALAKTDDWVARRYADVLAEDRTLVLLPLLEAEHRRSVEVVLEATGLPELLAEVPWLQRSLAIRNPYVDPLNLLQVELFRRLRRSEAEPERAEGLRELVRMTIQGVAAGMRTTG